MIKYTLNGKEIKQPTEHEGMSELTVSVDFCEEANIFTHRTEGFIYLNELVTKDMGLIKTDFIDVKESFE